MQVVTFDTDISHLHNLSDSLSATRSVALTRVFVTNSMCCEGSIERGEESECAKSAADQLDRDKIGFVSSI